MTFRIKVLLGTILSMVGLLGSFALGYFSGGVSALNSDENLSSIVTAWQIITTEYVEPDIIDQAALAEAAIKGMMDELNDPHSVYLNAEDYQASLEYDDGQYVGIGATVQIEDGVITLIPYEGSPAALAGIKAGDILLEVDGQSVDGFSLADLSPLVRGEKGTLITLKVERSTSAQPLLFNVTRDEILIPSVSSEMMGDIAYIRLSRFSERTDAELEQVLKNLGDAKGIVLDLRGNPGGLVSSVINVTSRFVSSGVVLTTVDNAGNSEEYKIVPKAVTTSLPMVVLVDQYSASGSEALSGALQDYGRATIVGKTTYGKGSVNRTFDVTGNTGIYLTIGRWYTPNGRMIEGQGITPDIELELAGDEAVKWALNFMHGEA
ncbi:S41 family peptidase [Dehalococcoides mccartyi]|jgi:carboxyl-terminal processing protease|uniref:Carboxyl-terminal protease n=1 Tax=Dehalococcoides mccartyi TaxID=61435 RepID=A0A142V939_9CHLR|nr:S41 family peptidase [Dehalococcoides mccartyi]AII60472.1 peptidase S41 [Dehalococcoides mccartyi CG5]AMU86131.1 carboxyl-terminal protease [Dehalococcoides mccartyi]AOV98975.1 periplasmic protease [Dehalococcoides mccartyi]MBA2084742.1 Carboxyl-terminal protease [Dehalococcoides mccartyi]QBX63487.1 S41 family peptidase [Dehalococcoides mccartyi]